MSTNYHAKLWVSDKLLASRLAFISHIRTDLSSNSWNGRRTNDMGRIAGPNNAANRGESTWPSLTERNSSFSARLSRALHRCSTRDLAAVVLCGLLALRMREGRPLTDALPEYFPRLNSSTEIGAEQSHHLPRKHTSGGRCETPRPGCGAPAN